MRTPILTTSLLLGSCLACGAALAQQAAATNAPQPTASTTIVVAQEDTPAPAAGMPAEVQPTASTTIVVAQDVPTAAVPQPEVQPTASTTIVTTPAPVTVPTEVQPTASTTIVTTPAPLPPGFQPAEPATVVLPAAVAPTATATITPVATTVPVAPGTDPVIDAATYQKRTEFDNTPYRFNMEQNGKRMTADEFSAWMAARGVRVARGPLPHRPENPTMDKMPGQGSTRPVGVRQEMVLAPMPAATEMPPVVAPATQALPASPAPMTSTLPAAGSPTAAPPPGALAPGTLQPSTLQPGSVAPTDEWTETGVPAAPTASTTLVVPVDPEAVEGADSL